MIEHKEFKFWATEFMHKGYRICITTGGAGALPNAKTGGWDYTSSNIKVPDKKPSKKKLLEMADQIVMFVRI